MSDVVVQHFPALSRWVPGRTAVGLKQAHSTHVQGSEHKVMVKLRNNSWPENLTDLLSAWPGPQTGHMVSSSNSLRHLLATNTFSQP